MTDKTDKKSDEPQYAGHDAMHQLRFTAYIETWGEKNKCVKDIGLALSRILYMEFKDRYKLVDHRSRVVEFDPTAHHFGLGENFFGTDMPREPEETLVIDGVKYQRVRDESTILDSAKDPDVV